MKFGVMGGSGLYKMDSLSDVEEKQVTTPFGEPSDNFIIGKLGDQEVVFLPRHGKNHAILPHEINYRANIWGMKFLGVTHLISVSAVGSLKEEIEPGHIVIPDQFIDRTKDRPSTFFGNGCAAHVQFGNPVCSDLGDAIEVATKATKVPYHRGGTYVCMEGPIFSTKAESEMYRHFGASVIGMTNLQEAKLAREAELCFATIALSTDYDCWHESEEEVTIDAVIAVMNQNVENAQNILRHVFKNFKEQTDKCPDQSALQFAIMTKAQAIPPQTRKSLSMLIDKYIS